MQAIDGSTTDLQPSAFTSIPQKPGLNRPWTDHTTSPPPKKNKCQSPLTCETQCTYILSHVGTVVPECSKDDNASQWTSGKFDPRPEGPAIPQRLN